MLSMQVARPILVANIEKMKIDLMHGYWLGARSMSQPEFLKVISKRYKR